MKNIYDVFNPLYKVANITEKLGLGVSGFGIGQTIAHTLIKKGRMSLADIILVASGALVFGISKYYTHKCEKRYDEEIGKIWDSLSHYKEN